MAGPLSKLACEKLTCSCYELGHTWTPSCFTAFSEVWLKSFKRSVEVYAPLYIVTAILRKRGKDYFFGKMLLEILQSSLFLSANGSLYLGGFCLARNTLGAFYLWSTIICSGLPASAIAISIERKSRRGILALYLSNLATETIFNGLKSRGLIKPIKNGEVLIFSIAVSLYMYFYKLKNGLDKSTESGLKYIFGPSEIPPKDDSVETTVETRQTRESRFRLPPQLQQLIDRLKNAAKHKLCNHSHSCYHYVLRGFVRNFVMGYGIQGAFKFVGALTVMFKKPHMLYGAIIDRENFQLGTFLGLFNALFRAICCLLRWYRNKDSAVHGLIAGFISAWSMVYYKSSSIALYVASKLAELLWFKGVDAGKLPYWKHGDSVLYAVTTAIVLHAAVFEPHNLRLTYWVFLQKLTGYRFGEMNRRLIDPFVHNSSKMFPHYWPKYDPKYLTTISGEPPLSTVLK
ncbi:transmembrane protein 135-like [Glandiceps talaboti]